MDSWKFLSYRRNFPPLLVTVERDDEVMEKIHDALTIFLNTFKQAMDLMIEINGGPPPKRLVQPKSQYINILTDDYRGEHEEVGIAP